MSISKKYFIFLCAGFLLIQFGCEDNNDEKEYEIAFAAEQNGISNIYTMALENNSITPITEGQTPKYMPDGNNIVFYSEKDIFVIGNDGEEKTNLTNSSYFEFRHSVANDGSMIIYSSDQDKLNNDHRTEIYSITFENNETTRLTNSQHWASDAIISPNLTYLSYFSWDSVNSYYSLILLDLNTSVQDTIFNHCWTSSFSSDETLICYSVMDIGLTITNLNSYETNLLIDEGFYPMFSPNGESVYYMTVVNDDLVIARINLDGSEKIYFPTGPVVMGQFDISSDGELLIFVKIKDDNTKWISTINSDGTNLKELTRGYSPTFRP